MLQMPFWCDALMHKICVQISRQHMVGIGEAQRLLHSRVLVSHKQEQSISHKPNALVGCDAA